MPDFAALVIESHRISLELTNAPTLDELYRSIVKAGIERLDFDRLGLLLYDPDTEMVRGTWGIDNQGQLVDETGYLARLDDNKRFIQECLEQRDFVAIWENHDLVYADKPAGKGWNGMVVLRDGQKPFGWIAADNLLRGRPLEPGRKELLGLYGLIASNLILPKRYGEELERRIAEKTAELRLSEEHYRELYAGMSRDNELKERLFTILAHDLRGPVGSVKGLVDMICDQPEQFGPESLQQMMPEIRRSLGQTYGLLENLLDWIRSQLQGIEVLRKRIELGQAINTACELFTRNREEKDIRLELTVQQGLSVVSDERMLGTILRNLVSNAVKYSPAGSAIRISAATDPTGEWVIIEVADQGAGVEPGLAATLFTSNMGRGKPGTGDEKGNGLGLMFSSQLAARIGGRIELATTTGKGSTFRLILPDELDGELVPLD